MNTYPLYPPKVRDGDNIVWKAIVTIFFIKTTILVLIVGSFVTPNARAQTTVEPHVSLKVENMPLKEVLKILELKTHITFSYLNEELPLDERITLDVNDEPLRQVLETLSNRCALTFTRIDNIMTIKQRKGEDKTKRPQGVGILRGTVRDSVTSEVLPYANVFIREINRGASTDNRGFFLIPSISARRGIP